MAEGSRRKRAEFSRGRGYAVLLAALILFWFIITGDFSLYSFTLGILSSLIIAYTTRKIIIGQPMMRKRPLKDYVRGVEYFTALAFSALVYIVYSNAFLIYQAMTLKIEPRIVRVRVQLDSDLELSIISNLITLTPGTLVIDVEEAEEGYSYLYVHFSYLKSKHVGADISGKIGKWDELIGGMFT